MNSIISQLLRVRITQTVLTDSIHTATMPLCFNTSGPLCVFSKKQIKMLNKTNLDKKKKKFEKELKKHVRQQKRILKPVEELEISNQLKRDIAEGKRSRDPVLYTEDELESMVLLEKDWCRYKMKLHMKFLKDNKKLQISQERALNALRDESETLYQQAVEIDEQLIPLTIKGPVITPPTKDGFLEASDGMYTDITNYFDKEIVIYDHDAEALKKGKKKEIKK